MEESYFLSFGNKELDKKYSNFFVTQKDFFTNMQRNALYSSIVNWLCTPT